MEYIIILCTVPKMGDGGTIAKALVKKKLAACCNIIPNLRSIYSWKEKICDDKELLLVIKTKKSLFKKCETEILKLHPYDTPEIISVPIKNLNKKYASWLKEGTL